MEAEREQEGSSDGTEVLDLSQPELQLRKCTSSTADDTRQKNRDRNRIHARNTRARKKAVIVQTAERIEQLTKEKEYLQSQLLDSAAVGLLTSLSDASPRSSAAALPDLTSSPSTSTFSDNTLKKLRKEISSDFKKLLAPEEANPASQLADISDPEEIEKARREINRQHARKTRLRKKMLVQASANILHDLEKEVHHLRALVNQQQSPPPPPGPPPLIYPHMPPYYTPPHLLPPYALPPYMVQYTQHPTYPYGYYK